MRAQQPLRATQVAPTRAAVIRVAYPQEPEQEQGQTNHELE